MKFKIVFNPNFQEDITQAVNWYNHQHTGLGTRFFNIVKKQTAELSTSALHFSIRYDDVRCFRVEKFPYLVHYRVNEQARIVKVEALLHTSRNPELWTTRE
ncbi:MAG TPA: type II toxin-antitoxin system RelE/ParE family toxin [Prolixibacteraceae bacterium]|nr:type II toxin-antitoxin system RelE/ParE family toxin [Prolixibacteraceae bacterium]